MIRSYLSRLRQVFYYSWGCHQCGYLTVGPLAMQRSIRHERRVHGGSVYDSAYDGDSPYLQGESPAARTYAYWKNSREPAALVQGEERLPDVRYSDFAKQTPKLTPEDLPWMVGTEDIQPGETVESPRPLKIVRLPDCACCPPEDSDDTEAWALDPDTPDFGYAHEPPEPLQFDAPEFDIIEAPRLPRPGVASVPWSLGFPAPRCVACAEPLRTTGDTAGTCDTAGCPGSAGVQQMRKDKRTPPA